LRELPHDEEQVAGLFFVTAWVVSAMFRATRCFHTNSSMPFHQDRLIVKLLSHDSVASGANERMFKRESAQLRSVNRQFRHIRVGCSDISTT
jgi:hypothetical protein